MSEIETEELKYPIGRFTFNEELVKNSIEELIREIEETPNKLRKAVNGLDEMQLDTHYRENGWTVRQVIHHLPGSHLNSYLRFKLSLIENEPSVKTYNEKEWANLIDSIETPVSVSLDLLDALHRKWVVLLRYLTPLDFERKYNHPDLGKVSLYYALAQYAWHGKHHVAHITSLRKRMGWE